MKIEGGHEEITNYTRKMDAVAGEDFVFWGGSSLSKNIFTVKKRIQRVMVLR